MGQVTQGIGPGKRQQCWDDGPLAMHEREALRRARVQTLLKQRVDPHRRVIAAVSKAHARGKADGKTEA